MIPLFTKEQFKIATSRERLPLKCEQCQKTFLVEKHEINKVLTGRRKKKIEYKFCSKECSYVSQTTSKTIACKQCGKSSKKQLRELKKSKTKNFFCSQSCAAIYNNAHKKHGYRRSKLEMWIESEVKKRYPNLEILAVEVTTINAELDLYFPTLKLAFEFNGVFHYEPIYGEEKLKRIKSNDQRKFQACIEKGIELCIIDSSSLEYFKISKAQKYLDIVTSILDQKLSTSLPAFAVSG